MIHQLTYRSLYTVGTPSRLAEFRAILSTSKRNNEADDITGFLLCDSEGFFQILEGARERVGATFRRIELDPRHRGIAILVERNLPQRSFPEWSMGGAWRGPENDEIFLRHGVDPSTRVASLPFPRAFSLAMDLQDLQRAKRDSSERR